MKHSKTLAEQFNEKHGAELVANSCDDYGLPQSPLWALPHVSVTVDDQQVIRVRMGTFRLPVAASPEVRRILSATESAMNDIATAPGDDSYTYAVEQAIERLAQIVVRRMKGELGL